MGKFLVNGRLQFCSPRRGMLKQSTRLAFGYGLIFFTVNISNRRAVD